MRRTLNGHELGYEVRGDGPALLLLHPFPYDRRIWDDVAGELAARRRVVTLDFRGFGESAPSGPYVLADLADDVAALLDALGVPMATVLGMSMGGYVALALAAAHPARLGALVLCDTRAGADSDEGRRAREAAIAQVRAGGLGAFLDAQPGRLLSAHAEPSLRARVRALGEQPADAVAHGLAAMRDRPDRTGELARIDVPSLALVGAEDTLTPPAEAQRMADGIPGARYAELPRAGHLAHLEQPAAFCRTVTEFLDENDR